MEINSECTCGGGFIVSRSAADIISLSTVQCIKLSFECTLKPQKEDIFCNQVTILESVRKELFLFGVMKLSDRSWTI